jgi:phosphatidylinositol alpha 1,6-mannosyltransferase
VKVALVTESFLPSINGVTNSVLRILETLTEDGDQALVIAPTIEGTPSSYAGHPVRGVSAIPTQNFLPVNMPMAIPQRRIKYLLAGFNPEVIHLASPFALGSYAVKVAKQLQVPTISVYQTQLGGFAKEYGLGLAQNSLQKILYRIHAQSDRTLAPSNSACLDLHLAGIPNVHLWQRGVDTKLFNPNKRDSQLQASWRGSKHDKTIVGYVGRLAQEKRILDLLTLDNDPNIQLVIVGDGAQKGKLQGEFKNAIFTGIKTGEELAKHYASLDLFVHPGPNETFCQSVQEALSSGVPAIVPSSGGPADLVANNQTGYIIDTSNSEQLRQTVSKYRARPNKSQMRIAARDSVSTRTWQRINSQLKEHYRQVIAEHAKQKMDSVVVA